MKIISTPFAGLSVIELEKKEDIRGFFARVFDANEFSKLGLKERFVQANVSLSKKKGTLRGIHFQKPPHAEAKLIRCTRGAFYDVAVDLRTNSSTYRQWFGIELSADNYKQLYVPEGFAHGFLTLTDDTEATYYVSEYYHPESESGVRFDDPGFGIKWPVAIEVITDKDRSWPDYSG